MSRFKLHDDWQVRSQYDCHFGIACRSLNDAVWIAALKGDDSFITVHADCERDGVEAVAHVGINAKETRGKSITEILELLDKKVDEYIASRIRTGHWKSI